MLKSQRNTKRNLLLTVIYRLSRLPFMGKRAKFKMFAELEWIFDRLAHEKSFDFYEKEKHPIRINQKQSIMPIITESSTVLDIGCKYGDVCGFIAEKAKLVVGIDKDEEAIKQALVSHKRENLEFYAGDVFEYFEKSDKRFDVIILMHILGCFEKPEQFLMEIKKHCSTIYIEMPDHEKSFNNIYREDIGSSLVYSDTIYIWEFTRTDLDGIFKKCGLVIESFQSRFGVLQYWLKVQ